MPQRLLMLLLLAVPTPALADVELTPMVGYRTGTAEPFTKIVCALQTDIAAIGLPCPDRGESEDDLSFGLILDIELNDRWMLEILLNRQNSDIEVNFSPCEFCLSVLPLVDELELTTIQIGFQRRWKAGRIEPFAAFGIGLTEVSTSSPTFSLFNIDEEGPSASLAAGLKVPLTSLLALRFEARGYWIELSDDFADDLVQGELSTGLTFRF